MHLMDGLLGYLPDSLLGRLLNGLLGYLLGHSRGETPGWLLKMRLLL